MFQVDLWRLNYASANVCRSFRLEKPWLHQAWPQDSHIHLMKSHSTEFGRVLTGVPLHKIRRFCFTEADPLLKPLAKITNLEELVAFFVQLSSSLLKTWTNVE